MGWAVGTIATGPGGRIKMGPVDLMEEMVMYQAHVSALQSKHASLEARIAEESQRPIPDMATLALLKKENLKVKEEIDGIH